MSFKPLAAFMLGAISVIAAAPGMNAQKKTNSHPAAKSSGVAGASMVTEIDGAGLKQLVHPSSPSARPILVNFWATWCDPCREEYPDLVKINAQFKDRSFNFITVSLDDVEDIKTKVPEFLKQMHAPMTAYLLNTTDQEAAIASVDPNWTGSLPATFLLNAKGEVVYRHVGRVNAAELASEVDKLTAAK